MYEESSAKKPKLSSLKRVYPFFKGHGRQLIFAIILVVLTTGLSSSLPLVFRQLLDKAIPSRIMGQVLAIGFAYLGLLVLQGGFQYIQSLIVGFMGIEIVNDVKRRILRHILNLPISFYDKHVPGKLMSRIENDSQKLFMLFSSIGLNFIWAIMNIIISFTIMFSTNAKLTLVVVGLVPVFAGTAIFYYKVMRPMFRQERELYSRITGFLGEHLKSIPILRNLNNLDWSRNKNMDVNQTYFKMTVKIYGIEQLTWFVVMLLPQLIIVLILQRSVSWIKAGTITIGTVWMFIQYLMMAIEPLIMISEQIGEIQRALGATDRIFEILDTESELKDGTDDKDFTFNDEIRFENVSFAYEPDKPVLKNIDLTIKKGTALAIVGPTGSGKTTIISLLTRFYDPQEGRILIDGHDLRSVSRKALRSKMSLVLQDIYLFPGSIMDNLRVLRQDIPEENAEKATRVMGIEKIIARMPKGFDTPVAEEGGNLSFGERQLLSFSRALTFDPEILIMDEATSSVDPYTEEKIQQSMMKLLTGRTSIIIAHRLSTIVHADKIVVVKAGRIVEEGTHNELLTLNGEYAKLYITQMGAHHAE
ncbi:MAG: ABC transporter ATP-binding protein [Candidatus Cloacimonetes bacterium]|nr:ABC transporter ATP-binding protein [Candidatus Cloacimonadota bacterium]